MDTEHLADILTVAIKRGVDDGQSAERILQRILCCLAGAMEYHARQGNPRAARANVQINRLMPHLINAGAE